MDISRKTFPDTLTIGGADFPIHTEHFFWIRLARVINEKGEAMSLDDCAFVFDGNIPPRELWNETLDEIVKFYAPKKQLPRESGGDCPRLVDYYIDGNIIFSSFLKCYGVNLKRDTLHWHEFIAMLEGLRGTAMNDVMAWRSYKGKDKDMIAARKAWALPTVESIAAKASDDLWVSIFGKQGELA